MTRIEYDLLSSNEPDLDLPPWTILFPDVRDSLATVSREDFVTRRRTLITIRALLGEPMNDLWLGTVELMPPP